MATKVVDIAAGSATIPVAVQFGARTIVCYEDQRPYVVMPDATGTMTAYSAGIKAPTVAPTVAVGAASVNHRILNDYCRFAYCFWSEHRGVFSELSPPSPWLAMSGYKLTVNTFQAPRDTYSTQAISHIVIGMQLKSVDSGPLCLWDVMKVDASDGTFTSKSFTIDLSPEMLRHGFDLSGTGLFSRVPGGMKYAARSGERIWYCPGATQTAKAAATCATLNTTWRGHSVCRLTLTNGTFNDGDHGRAVYSTAGSYIGIIWDVHSSTVAYTERAVPTALNSQNIAGITLKSIGDSLWPSAYHEFNVGSVPLACAECVSPPTTKRIPALTDDGGTVRGLVRVPGGLVVLTNDAPVYMDDVGIAKTVNLPDPNWTPIAGVLGSPADRGTAQSAVGEAAWLTTNGPMIWTGGAAEDLAAAYGCTRLFKGQEWVDPSTIDTSVACYVRDFDGFLFGRLTIGGTADQWILFTRRPQVGFWRMSAVTMRSNLLEYPASDGRSVILVGDATSGRVKRILDTTVLTDLDASDVATAHTWEYRGGWDRNENAERRQLTAIRLPGLIMPSGSVTISGTLWRGNNPVRHSSDVDSTFTHSFTITETTLLRDYTASPANKRFHSLALSGSSTTGTSSGKSWRPLELLRWELIYEGDGK